MTILYPDETMHWARIYGPEVDKLFQRDYIEWKFKDSRGAYYSTIKLTAAGKQHYEKKLKDKKHHVNQLEDPD